MAGDNSGFSRTSDTTMSRSRPRKLNSSILTIFFLPPPPPPITYETLCPFFFSFFTLFSFLTISIFFVELCHEILGRNFFYKIIKWLSFHFHYRWFEKLVIFFSFLWIKCSSFMILLELFIFLHFFLFPSKIPNLFVSLSFVTCQNFELSSFRQ